MSLYIKSFSFLIESKDESLFPLNEDLFIYSEEWENALSFFFKDTIFVSSFEIFFNSKPLSLSLIFNPCRKKTYLISKGQTKTFIQKYFSNSKVMDREPELFSFLLPFPDIDFFKENWKSTEEDKYCLSISKFRHRTYQNIESYRIRLNIPKSIDFRENEFDPVFHAKFQDIFNFSENFKDYLSDFLSIDRSLINTQRLIVPFYILKESEIKSIIDIENTIIDQILTGMSQDSKKHEYEAMSRNFDSYLEDTYWDTFENDPSAFWNID